MIGLAIGGAILLRDRGIRGASSTTDLTGADPFIAAVPALAGLAAGLIALRLFALPVRGDRRHRGAPARPRARSWRCAGRPGPAAQHRSSSSSWRPRRSGRSRSRRSAIWRPPARRSRGRRSGRRSGSSRVSGRLPHDFDPHVLPGVDAAAGASRRVARRSGHGRDRFPGARRRRLPRRHPRDADRPRPARLADRRVGRVRCRRSSPRTGVVDGIKPGDPFTLTVGGKRVPFVAAEVDGRIPDRAGRAAVRGRRPGAPDRARPGRDLPDDHGVAARPRRRRTGHPQGAWRPRRRRRGPRCARSRRWTSARPRSSMRSPIGVIAAFVVACAYAAVALVAALALTGAARAAETAHLRTLGLGRRGSIGLTIVEHGPTVVLALVLGIAFGLATFMALRPGLGLGAVVGSALDDPTHDRSASARPGHRRGRGDREPGGRARYRGPTRTDGAGRPEERDRMTRARYGEGALIACDNLVRIFKVADLEVVALQGLDLLVERGEMMAIVGASGSGKSTLLNILGGLDAPSAGRAVRGRARPRPDGASRADRLPASGRRDGLAADGPEPPAVPERAGERRAADDPRRPSGAAGSSPRPARPRRPRGSRVAPARGPVGRRAAARRDRRGAGQQAGRPAGGRADRRAR